MGEVIITSILYGFDQKNFFTEEWSWFKFNNLRLPLGINLKLHTSVEKGLRLKFRKFWWINPTFVEVAGKKLVGGDFLLSPSPPSPHLEWG